MDGEKTNAGPIAKSLAGGVKGEFTKVKGTLHNVDGATTGLKTLTKVSAGHGSEKKGSSEPSGTNTKSVVDKKF